MAASRAVVTKVEPASSKRAAPRRRSRAENRDYRRESLIDAATRVIAAEDLSGATVERICEEAGVSRGLLSHYFDSKEQLLAVVCEAVWEADLSLKREIKDDSRMSGREKLSRMIEATFLPPVFTSESVAAWRAFLQSDRPHNIFRNPIRKGARAYRKVFREVFQQTKAEEGLDLDPSRAALGLILMIDGCWISLSTNKDDMTPMEAVSLCRDALDRMLEDK